MKTIEIDADALARIIQEFQIDQESERPLGNYAFAQKAIKDHYENKRRETQKECKESGHMWTWMPLNKSICFRCGEIINKDHD